jgi:acetyl-CoA carboxylase, biotin carboxylase subunit
LVLGAWCFELCTLDDVDSFLGEGIRPQSTKFKVQSSKHKVQRPKTKDQKPKTTLPMFRKVLIANRGEIAVRIIRTCRELGITPVAVYSEVDAEALHVRLADEAVCVGPASSAQSYLNIPAIVAAATSTNAEAIHPGYGFLAENADFARAVTIAGLTYIGPTPEAMEIMSSKTSARRAAVQAGVAIVPGTVEPLRSFAEAKEISQQLGFPLMLKAAAGGGGKGMRLVRAYNELLSAFQTAQAEATAAFGDSSLYIEKALERPRHIEIQVFADTQDNVVHLGERECSIQRRHQKVVEECPSPIDDPDLRRRMGEAAVKITRAVNYTGAGTVEFLVEDATRDFYFLEMNTRLQVEHPVTELVTGFDLVREQFSVAAGGALSFKQEDVRLQGHAIECRIYAEDPDNNFFPSPGTITHLQEPSGPGVRIDSGVRLNSEVSIHYDSMISKLAVWGRSRSEAIDRLRRALDEYEVSGITTTLPFFRQIVRDEEFIAGRLDTGFIVNFNARRDSTQRAKGEVPTRVVGAGYELATVDSDMALVAAALQYIKNQRRASVQVVAQSSDRWKLSGRTALVNTNQAITRRTKAPSNRKQ